MLHEFSYERLEEVDLSDNFFISLKNKYDKFEDWFNTNDDYYAYIEREDNEIKGFMYLKLERGIIEEINPAIMFHKIVNIKGLKISLKDRRLVECFIKKSLDFAIMKNTNRVVVCIDKDNEWLIDTFKIYGFRICAERVENNSKEKILLKDLKMPSNDIRLSYPKIDLDKKAYILPMFKQNHDRHFPKTVYTNEFNDIVEDISITNSIEKLHITKFEEVSKLKRGDILLIYKKSDALVPSEYRSMTSCICVVDEVRKNSSFDSLEEYKNYCEGYDSYSEEEFESIYYNKDTYYTIKMTFNAVLPKKITRHDLIEDINLTHDSYWGFFEISKEKLESIFEFGELNRRYIKE